MRRAKNIHIYTDNCNVVDAIYFANEFVYTIRSKMNHHRFVQKKYIAAIAHTKYSLAKQKERNISAMFSGFRCCDISFKASILSIYVSTTTIIEVSPIWIFASILNRYNENNSPLIESICFGGVIKTMLLLY